MKSHITGNVKTTEIIIIIAPIFSRGMKNAIINRTNVNPAKMGKNIRKNLLNIAFGNSSTPNAYKNHETIKRIEKLTKQKDQLKALGLQGYNYIEKYYVWSKIMQDFKKIIIKLIKKKKSSKNL